MRRADGDAMPSPGVEAFSRDLRGIRMDQLSAELRQTRETVEAMKGRDLRRGFTLTLLVLLGTAWVASLAPLIVIAHRISQPIQQLTAGLTDFADGGAEFRIEPGIVEQEGAVADDAGEDVVEIVRDATGELADGLHFLRLLELQFQFLVFGDVGDHAAKTRRRGVRGDGAAGNADPAALAGLGHQAAFERFVRTGVVKFDPV